jgi:hypothetical protein
MMNMIQIEKKHIKEKKIKIKSSRSYVETTMHKQFEGIGSSTRRITGKLLHREDLDFKINDSQKQIGPGKKKNSEE